MKVEFFAPSYKRPEKALTQKNYPFVTLIVSESEADQYVKNGNHVIVCPDEVQGNLCRVRNWIIDTQMKDNDCIVLMDDDCGGVNRYQVDKYTKMAPDELEEFAEAMTILTYEFGFKMWGVNPMTGKGAYRDYTPFSTNAYIGGPFQAHMNGTELRYDESLNLKEDYDMTLQQLKAYRGLLRANMVNLTVRQAEQSGGCASQRNTNEEKRQFNLLLKKWGTKILRTDKSTKRDFDFNPILKSPIKGV